MSDTIPKVVRWIDIESADAKRIEYHSYVRQVIDAGLKYGIIKPDKQGNLYLEDGVTPVHAELDGQIVGLRASSKAAN